MSMMPLRLPQLSLICLCCLLAACQTFRDGDRQLKAQSERLLAESLAQSEAGTPPPAVQAALIPPLRLESAGRANGPRFDVAVRDMEAREFFLSLMDGAGENLVVHPEVSGLITFSLRNVTLEEVLGAVRDTYGYDYRRTSYGYRILPNQLITRTYNLNYLNLQRRGETDTRVSSGQVTANESSLNNGSGGTGSSEGSGGSGVSTVNASQVVTSSEVDFWREVAGVIQALIGEEEGNRVVVNPQASLLVVRASSADQQNVEAFLEQAERNLQRQVVLEAKILEVNLKDGFQAGINWSDLGRDRNGNSRFGIVGDSLAGPQGVGGVFSAALTLGDFSGLLELLETQGQVRVLSSPRISTLNNQKAVIKVGSDEFFVTEVSSSNTVTSGGVSEPTQDVTLTPFFSGISLDVTPQINQHDEVTLHVRPSVSRVQDQNKVISLGEGRDLNLPLALSTTRQSDSIIRARSGQVVVIGGLLQNANDNLDAGVPWLSELPFVGWLFQQQRKDLERSELVILLRPQVVGADTWLEELRKSAASFGELD
ncbi:pilus (MSHA type) biogenesis protein MshL [Geopseudomonas guangdongensis]|uniref:MSHA biogenesis protein MshL n=1 Tax=Geopseudomonas guangdongensis TaxID=1245526 RepID=A0A1H2EI65_9GAMM|nr:pilus (MSHA type) biogenesis protein MshL [Pseudomonas guangdongensis]SDT94815.1 MSHA biogenesis protein MshL [Pseudomonas guangdongensis]